MAEPSKPQSGKTLEMRVTELEDKLAKTQITEDEIKAYNKVAAAMAAKGGTPAASGVAQTAAVPALSPQLCAISHPCIINQCIINQCVIHQCIIHPIIQDCTCGPCQQAGATAAAPAQKEFEDLGS